MAQVTPIKPETNQPQDTNALEQRIANLEKLLAEHQHTGRDKTKTLISSISIPEYEYFSAGNAYFSGAITNKDTASEVSYSFMNAGPDKESGFGDTTKNSEIFTQHSSSSTFFLGIRPPISNGSTTITSGASSLTDSNKSWTVDELSGAYISLVTTAGVLQTLPIASNTSNQITVTGTFTVSGTCTYTTFKPIYLGGANYPWLRAYVGDTNSGGIRFGYGATNGGTNSLLYTVDDSLKFRNTAGTVYSVDLTPD